MIRQLLVIAALLLGPRWVGSAGPATSGSSLPSLQRATVTGVVHDSIAGAPLFGAIVQLVADDTTTSFGQTVVSDALGRFTFATIPRGRYRIGFFHPMLDSLGLEPMTRALVVAGDTLVRVDLAIPSPLQLRTVVCGRSAKGDPPSLLFGIVRQAQGRSAVAAATVSAEWVELSISRTGMTRQTPRRVTTSSAQGWFAFCDVPSPGLIRLTASRLADSTDVLDLQMPASGFVRRELFVGASRATAGQAGVERAALIRGTVVAKSGGRPLGGAQIRVGDSTEVRANDRGEFTVLNAPAGTRMLEARAVGYYVDRRPVDIVDGASPLRVELETFTSVLDTMKVVANYDRYNDLAAFRERRRSGLGRFLVAEDIARRQPVLTSELFRNFQGLSLDGTDIEQKILMKSDFGERCEPTIFLNGQAMVGLDVATLDNFVRPKDIVGVEVYLQSQAPAQFQSGLSGCGCIVIWSR